MSRTNLLRLMRHAATSAGAVILTDAGAQGIQANAAVQTPTQEPISQVQIVGSAGDRERNLTVAKTVVGQEQIGRYGDATVSAVLARIPGVTVSGQGLGGIQMRGLGGGYTQILINGEVAPPGFSLESLSPNTIERIEVSRVATADVSAQSIAGSINIVLKQALRPGQAEIKAAVAGYAGNTSVYLDGQYSDREGDLSYSLIGGLASEKLSLPAIVEQRGFDGIGNPTSLRITTKDEHSKTDTLNLSPKLTWKVGTTDSVNADALLMLRRANVGLIDTRETLFGSEPLYPLDDLRLHADIANVRTNLSWAHKFDDGAKLDVKLGANYNRRKSVAKFFGFNGPRTVLDEDTNSLAIDKNLTFIGKYRVPFRENHAIAIGWDSEVGERSEDRIQRQTAPAGYPAVDLDEVYDARVTRLALFAQDEWDLSERLSGYMGLRWEALQTRSAGNVLTAVENRSSVFSPVMQLVWKLPDTKNDQIRFGISRTYKAPGTRDLMPRRYVANDNTATTPDLQGNPDLRPELAWGADLAYEHYFSDAGMVSLGTSARRIEHVILQRLSLVGNKWVLSPFNGGTANVRSIEIETKINLAKLDKEYPDIDLRINGARNWSDVESVPGPHNRLERQTPVSANVGVDYRMPGKKFTFGGNFGYQGGGEVRLAPERSAYSGPKRTLDLYGTWQVRDKTQLRVTLTNLLHRDTIADAAYRDADQQLLQRTSTETQTVVRAVLSMQF